MNEKRTPDVLPLPTPIGRIDGKFVYGEEQVLQAIIADRKALRDPDWVCLEGMNREQLAAYDYGCASCEAAVLNILNGKDSGEGRSHEPWQTLRKQLLQLIARPAPSAPPVEVSEALDYLRSLRATLPKGLQKAALGAAIYTLAQTVSKKQLQKEKEHAEDDSRSNGHDL